MRIRPVTAYPAIEPRPGNEQRAVPWMKPSPRVRIWNVSMALETAQVSVTRRNSRISGLTVLIVFMVRDLLQYRVREANREYSPGAIFEEL